MAGAGQQQDGLAGTAAACRARAIVRSRATCTRTIGPSWLAGSRSQWPLRIACVAPPAPPGPARHPAQGPHGRRSRSRGRFAPSTGTPARTAAITAGAYASQGHAWSFQPSDERTVDSSASRGSPAVPVPAQPSPARRRPACRAPPGPAPGRAAPAFAPASSCCSPTSTRSAGSKSSTFMPAVAQAARMAAAKTAMQIESGK